MKRLRVFAIIIVAAILLVVLGGPAYKPLMARRLLHAAQSADGRGADLEADGLFRLAVQRNPANREILRAYAGFLSRRHDPVLLQVRERLRQMQPDDPGSFFDCVESAFFFQQPDFARTLLLRRAPPKARDTAHYYHLLSVSHFLAREYPQADAAAAEALRREPSNKVYLADQACIRICCLDPDVHEKARNTLFALVDDRDEHRSALHALLLDAVQLARDASEPRWLTRLIDEGEKSLVPGDAFYTDYLAVLQRWRPEAFALRLPGFLEVAGKEEFTALFAQRWLSKQQLFQNQLDFRATLPPGFQNEPESMLLAAEAAFQLHEWDRLDSLLNAPAWNQCEIFVHAWQERLRRGAHGGGSGDSASKVAWHKLISAPGATPTSLVTLSRLLSEWGWRDEFEQTLWILTNRPSHLSPEALRQLSRHYLEEEDAAGMLRVLQFRLLLDSEDPVVGNNFAYTSFLLGRNSKAAQKCVDDLCERYPQSTAFAATRAFGLLMDGHAPAALQCLERFPAERLRGTAQGVTYGLILAANRHPLAGDFLKDASRLVHFPEERQLVADAQEKIGK